MEGGSCKQVENIQTADGEASVVVVVVVKLGPCCSEAATLALLLRYYYETVNHGLGEANEINPYYSGHVGDHDSCKALSVSAVRLISAYFIAHVQRPLKNIVG